MFENIDDWCRGRNWLIRLPVFALMAYEAYGYVKDPYTGGVFSAITFGVHELGHLLFRPFGEWMSVLGGSLTQLAAPAITMVLFWRQPDYFGMTVGGIWLGTALFELAVYVEDAATMTLPLLSMSDEAYHDWNYLLTSVNRLSWDVPLSHFFRLCGDIALISGLLAGAWLLWKMATLTETTL